MLHYVFIYLNPDKLPRDVLLLNDDDFIFFQRIGILLNEDRLLGLTAMVTLEVTETASFALHLDFPSSADSPKTDNV
jgi:hypothetical protein